MVKTPQYVFRGTTVKFGGSMHSQSLPMTSVSTHPVIALWFAKECMQAYPEKACIYIAETNELLAFKKNENVLAPLEREIAYGLKPADFYKHSLGYISVQVMQEALRKEGIDSSAIARLENLSFLCSETKDISAKKIAKIVTEIKQYLKND